MSPLDAVWLAMESPETPMHVGALATFHRPSGASDQYLAQWVAVMREHSSPVAPWNRKLAVNSLTPLTPRLVEDRNFDLDYHFRHLALPAPGGERELGRMVSRLHSNALDRNRPLWEFHVIEGLEGERFAIYIKIHHALVDNVNAIPLLVSQLSASARTRHMKPLWASPLCVSDTEQENEDDDLDLSFLNPMELGGTISALGKASGSLLRMAFRRDHGTSLSSLGAPRSTLNRRINAQRRFATQQFPQSRIQALANATDSTLNEVLAYLCGSSLRRFFKEYNALPDDSLMGALPVSLQERSERLPGNAIAGIRVALATHLADPMKRLEAVKASMKAVRKDRESLPDAAVTPYIMLRSAPLYASQLPAIGALVPPVYNLAISNTPGPAKPLFFNGARMESLYPMSQLMQFRALSIDCVSYAGTLNIGFTGARDTLPHLQRLAVYLGKAVTDLESLVTEKEGAL
tara:strand:- start:1239 stop:2624 length:1386 start_codon:yes stop_codon:yes gene_type:complete